MKKIITAINDKVLNEELRKNKDVEIICKDIQYKEGILEILEINFEIDYIFINYNLPGEISIQYLINMILKIKQCTFPHGSHRFPQRQYRHGDAEHRRLLRKGNRREDAVHHLRTGTHAGDHPVRYSGPDPAVRDPAPDGHHVQHRLTRRELCAAIVLNPIPWASCPA